MSEEEKWSGNIRLYYNWVQTTNGCFSEKDSFMAACKIKDNEISLLERKGKIADEMEAHFLDWCKYGLDLGLTKFTEKQADLMKELENINKELDALNKGN